MMYCLCLIDISLTLGIRNENAEIFTGSDKDGQG